MRGFLARWLFRGAMLVFGLNGVFHFGVVAGFDWWGYAARLFGLLVDGAIVVCLPALLAEYRPAKWLRLGLFKALWPADFLGSMPGWAMIGAALLGLYWVFNVLSFVQGLGSIDATAGTGLLLERCGSGLALSSSGLAALFYRYTLPQPSARQVEAGENVG